LPGFSHILPIENNFLNCNISNVPPGIFFSHRLLTLLRSRASASTGKSKEPPGRTKITTAGMIFAMFLRCLFISVFSSLVHFSSVFRVFMRSCISPLIARTSMRMASLFTMMRLLRYFLIIYTLGTTVEVGSVSGPSPFFLVFTIFTRFRTLIK